MRDRVVLLAPHPDDEVLGCAGILHWLRARAVPVLVVAVTDGEASHARSARVDPRWLRGVRARERAAALTALGLAAVPVVRWGFPDGAVPSTGPELTQSLLRTIDASTTLVVPWRHDGHPDHDACGRAGVAAAAAAGAGVWEVAIWAKVRRRFVPAHTLRLSRCAASKRAAVREFRSQVVAFGEDRVDGPVLSTGEIEAMTGPFEYIVSVA